MAKPKTATQKQDAIRHYWAGVVKGHLDAIERLEQEMEHLRDINGDVLALRADLHLAETRGVIARDMCAHFKWPESGPFFSGYVEAIKYATELLNNRTAQKGPPEVDIEP